MKTALLVLAGLLVTGFVVAFWVWALDGLSGSSREEEIANERARLDGLERLEK